MVAWLLQPDQPEEDISRVGYADMEGSWPYWTLSTGWTTQVEHVELVADGSGGYDFSVDLAFPSGDISLSRTGAISPLSNFTSVLIDAPGPTPDSTVHVQALFFWQDGFTIDQAPSPGVKVLTVPWAASALWTAQPLEDTAAGDEGWSTWPFRGYAFPFNLPDHQRGLVRPLWFPGGNSSFGQMNWIPYPGWEA